MLRKLGRNVRRRWFAARWRCVAHVGYRPGPPPNGVTVGAVLLSYRRHQNINPMLDSLLRGELIDRVILPDDDPSTSIQDLVTRSDPRLTMLDQPARQGPGMRWRLANEMLADVDVVVCIDDDLFLFPHQIERLVNHVVESPEMPHGVVGRLGRDVVQRREASVDILLRAYAVTPAHVQRYMEILDAMPERRHDAEHFADDVVISLAGDAPPRVHDVGYLLSCNTSDVPGIALHLQPGFHQARRAVFAEAIAARLPRTWRPSESAV